MQNLNDFGLYGAQVIHSREKFGPNTLPSPRIQSFWEKYIENFEDPLIRILCFCVVIVMFLAYCGYASITESYGIIFSILISTFVGTLSEFRSEANFMELQKEASRVTVIVVRKGVGAWVDRALGTPEWEKLSISWKNPADVEEGVLNTMQVTDSYGARRQQDTKLNSTLRYVNPYTVNNASQESSREANANRAKISEKEQQSLKMKMVGLRDEDAIEDDSEFEMQAQSLASNDRATRIVDLELNTLSGKSRPESQPRKMGYSGKSQDSGKSICVSLRVEDLVVGDYVLLQPGDMVPADGYLVSGCVNVSQKSLTGEDIIIRKSPPPEFIGNSGESTRNSAKVMNPDTSVVEISGLIDDEAGLAHRDEETELCYIPPSIPMAVNNSGHADNLDELTTLYRGSLVEEGEAVMKVVSVGAHTVYARIVAAGDDTDDEEDEEDTANESGTGVVDSSDSESDDDDNMLSVVNGSKKVGSRRGDYDAVEITDGKLVKNIVDDNLYKLKTGGWKDEDEAARICRTREQPLRKKLSRLAQDITSATYKIATFMAVAFMVKQIVIDHDWQWRRIVTYLFNYNVFLHDLVTAVMYAVIVLVVSVPEGLPMMIALVLSLNMRKLLKAHVLVRRLIGIETAGSLNLLCVDKTGTLTVGEFACSGVLWLGRKERWLGQMGPLVPSPAPSTASSNASSGSSSYFLPSSPFPSPATASASSLSHSSSNASHSVALFHRFVGSCIRSACGRATISLPADNNDKSTAKDLATNVNIVGGNASDRAVLQYVYESMTAAAFTNNANNAESSPIHTDLFSPLPGQENPVRNSENTSSLPVSGKSPHSDYLSGLYSANVRIVAEKPFTSSSKRSLTQLCVSSQYISPSTTTMSRGQPQASLFGNAVVSGTHLADRIGAFVCDDKGQKISRDVFQNSDTNSGMNIGVTVIKGAAEAVLDQCTHVLLPASSQDATSTPFHRVPLLSDNLSTLTAEMDAMASQGARLIAVAISSDTIAEIESYDAANAANALMSPTNAHGSPIPSLSSPPSSNLSSSPSSTLSSSSLTLLCVLSLTDSLRPSTAPALAALRGAGVQVVMITGDKCETALAIATQAGMLHKSDGAKSTTGSAPLSMLSTSSSTNGANSRPTRYLWPRVLTWAHEYAKRSNTQPQSSSSIASISTATTSSSAIASSVPPLSAPSAIPSKSPHIASISPPASSYPLHFSTSSPLFLHNLLLCYLNTQRHIALTSSHLRLLSDAQLALLLPRLVVVARALPSDKVRILQVAQARHVLLAGDNVLSGVYGVGKAQDIDDDEREGMLSGRVKNGRSKSVYMRATEANSLNDAAGSSEAPASSSAASSSTSSSSPLKSYVSRKLKDSASYIQRYSLAFSHLWRVVRPGASAAAAASCTSSDASIGATTGAIVGDSNTLLSVIHPTLFWDEEHQDKIPMHYYTFSRVFGAEPPKDLLAALYEDIIDNGESTTSPSSSSPSSILSLSLSSSLSSSSLPVSTIRGPVDSQGALIPYVVGMLGDGVNDSAALKKADVSFAMGTATEITKEAADVVLLDNNLGSVVSAAKYGRAIFKSIRKFIVFQCTVNAVALIICVLGPFLGFDMPLTLVQLLWVNLIMDTFAALAFGGEPALESFLTELPVHRFCDIISPRMWASIKCNAVYIATLAVIFLTYDPCVDYFFSRVHESNDYVAALKDSMQPPPKAAHDIVIDHEGRTTIRVSDGLAITIGSEVPSASGKLFGKNAPEEPTFQKDMVLSHPLHDGPVPNETSAGSASSDVQGDLIGSDIGVSKKFGNITDSGADLIPARFESNAGLAKQGGMVFLTAFFSFFVMSCTVHAFNVRTGDAVSIFAHLRENALFGIIIPGILVTQVIFTSFYPFTQFLRTVPLTITEWLAVIIPAFSVLVFDAIRKKYFLKNIPVMDTVNYPDMYGSLAQYNRHYKKNPMRTPTISRLVYIPASDTMTNPGNVDSHLLDEELSYFCPDLRTSAVSPSLSSASAPIDSTHILHTSPTDSHHPLIENAHSELPTLIPRQSAVAATSGLISRVAASLEKGNSKIPVISSPEKPPLKFSRLLRASDVHLDIGVGSIAMVSHVPGTGGQNAENLPHEH